MEKMLNTYTVGGKARVSKLSHDMQCQNCSKFNKDQTIIGLKLLRVNKPGIIGSLVPYVKIIELCLDQKCERFNRKCTGRMEKIVWE